MPKGLYGVAVQYNKPKGKKTISNKSLYNNVAKFHFHIGVPWSNKLVMYDQMNGGNAARKPKVPGLTPR